MNADINHLEFLACSWIERIIKPGALAEVVDRTCIRLETIENPFSAIAFTGLSGSLVASAVSIRLNKTLYCVRKSGESKHSGNDVEGPTSGDYVIVDDFIDSGATVRRIKALVCVHTIDCARCVGIYEHRDDKLTTCLNALERILL